MAWIAVTAAACRMTAGAANRDLQLEQTPLPAARTVEASRVRGEELARVDAVSLDQALVQVRPELLRPNVVIERGSAQTVRPSVYLNDRYLGGVEALELIPREGVVEVRLLRPFAAQALFGSDCRCSGGVLAVVTRARKD